MCGIPNKSPTDVSVGYCTLHLVPRIKQAYFKTEQLIVNSVNKALKKFNVHLLILVFWGILFSPIGLNAQKDILEPKLGDTLNQDDLGNVTDAFQENFFEALAQKAIQNYEKAITALQKCEEIDSGQAVVYFEMGKNYQALRKYSQAIENYRKALQQKPKDRAILEMEYKLYLENREYKKAIPVVQQLQNKNADYQKDLAKLYLSVQNYSMALKMLDQLDENRGQTSVRDALRGKIYTESGDKQAEESYLKQKVREAPGNVDNYMELVYFYNQSKNYKKAKSTADIFAEAHPKSSLKQLGYYPSYLQKNKPEKALRAIQQLLKTPALNPVIKKRVIKDLTGFVKENPVHQGTFVKILGEEISGGEQNEQQLGEYYIEKDNAKALGFLESALEKNPTDFKLLKEVLQLQLAQNQFEKSLTLSIKALALYPSQAIFYLLKGRVEEGLKNYQKALQTLENGLNFLVDAPKTELKFYKRIALIHKATGNLQQAETFRQKADRLAKTIKQ